MKDNMEMADKENDKDINILSIRNAYKTFDGKNFVLKGLNMNVRKNNIYCLLGASGCGKSTLLNLIVGLIDLDSGIINTNVTSRDDIGYMTQNNSLCEQLNIYETFIYYGTIYGLSKEETTIEMDKFYRLLNLPEKFQCVHTLSGGERRRVSLAVALLKNPKLILLDEPTVGVDTLLRESIWEYLMKLCEVDKKTIIITTHYIEEGKQAHTIGFMREGRLLCEEPPNKLISTYNVPGLEQVFIALCQQTPEEPNEIHHPGKKTQYKFRIEASASLHIPKIRGEIKKNIIYLQRNISVAIFTLLLPAFCVVSFNWSLGNDPHLKFGIVNDEINFGTINCSNVNRSGNCNMEYLSCTYVEKLRNYDLELNEYADVSTAVEDVVRNKVWGVMHFPHNYSQSIQTLIEDPLTNDDSIFTNRAHLYMDYTNLMFNNFLMRNIRNGYADLVKDVYQNCSWPLQAALLPIKFQKPIYGESDSSLKHYFSPAMLTILLFSTPFLYGLTIMIEEKRAGTAARSIIAGVSVYEILISHFIVQSLLQMIQLFSGLFIYAYILGYSFKQPLLTTLLLYAQSIMGISIAFTIAAFTNNITVTGTFQVFLSGTTMMIGDFVWPLEGIPFPIRYASWMLPATFPIEAVRSLTMKGVGIEDFVVCRGFISTLVWTICLASFSNIYTRITRAKSYLEL